MTVRLREAKEGTWRLKLHMANLSVIYSELLQLKTRLHPPFHIASHYSNSAVLAHFPWCSENRFKWPPTQRKSICLFSQPSPAVIYACTSICCCLSVAIKYREKYRYFMFSQLWDLTVTLGMSHSFPPTVRFCFLAIQWLILSFIHHFTSCEILIYLAGCWGIFFFL